jgi:hypothetical protein
MTGPQTTPDEREDLAEAAGLLNAHLTCGTGVIWADVTALYCLEGWEKCPLALADVGIATGLEIPIKPFAP